jgi:type IV pilus assembly protein PilQ
VFLNTGETIAIGGIETDHKSESSARVPVLSRIPIIGALFKSRVKKDEKRELLIFITPYIVGETKEGDKADVAGTGQGNKENL